ncbi:MAG: hypothetical protein KAW88_08955 [Candidatus Cloacimonetes bacterium]|nr:hypothetical protein [Candidatus Cloacimonadota bacterium]
MNEKMTVQRSPCHSQLDWESISFYLVDSSRIGGTGMTEKKSRVKEQKGTDENQKRKNDISLIGLCRSIFLDDILSKIRLNKIFFWRKKL